MSLNPAIPSYEARLPFNWALLHLRLCDWITCLAGREAVGTKLKPTLMPQVFQAVAVLLSLMNIEIADFCPRGQATLIFEFGGHFGRDVAYSLSWSLFALAMMGYGRHQRVRWQAWAPFHDPVEGLFP